MLCDTRRAGAHTRRAARNNYEAVVCPCTPRLSNCVETHVHPQPPTRFAAAREPPSVRPATQPARSARALLAAAMRAALQRSATAASRSAGAALKAAWQATADAAACRSADAAAAEPGAQSLASRPAVALAAGASAAAGTPHCCSSCASSLRQAGKAVTVTGWSPTCEEQQWRIGAH